MFEDIRVGEGPIPRYFTQSESPLVIKISL